MPAGRLHRASWLRGQRGAWQWRFPLAPRRLTDAARLGLCVFGNRESLFLFLVPPHLAFRGISSQGGENQPLPSDLDHMAPAPCGGGRGPSLAFEPDTQWGRGWRRWWECGRWRPAAGLRQPRGDTAPAGQGGPSPSLSRSCFGSTSRALEGSERPGQRARPGTWGRNAGN